MKEVRQMTMEKDIDLIGKKLDELGREQIAIAELRAELEKKIADLKAKLGLKEAK